MREIADALRAQNPDSEIRTYDLENTRRDRRRELMKGRRTYTGAGSETLDEAVRREIQKIGSKYPWSGPYRWLVERAARRSTAATYAIMEPFLADCDAVVLWNGLRSARFAAASIARSRGLATVFIERGFFPNTVQVDSEGVNYGSSVARTPVAEIQAIELTSERQAWLETMAFEQRPLGNMKRPVLRNVAGLEEIVLPERFVLFVAQVHDDTQIDFYSPHFSTIEDAMRYAYAEIQAYNERHGDDLKLVVKEHPQDYKRAHYDDLRRELGGCLFLQHVDNDELLERSAAVVTINSSMGLQAIARDRPVVTLGQSVYSVPGAVYRAPEDSPLRDLIPSLLRREGLDRELQRKLLVYLRETLLDVPVYNVTQEQYDRLAERIWRTIDAQRAPKD